MSPPTGGATPPSFPLIPLNSTLLRSCPPTERMGVFHPAPPHQKRICPFLQPIRVPLLLIEWRRVCGSDFTFPLPKVLPLCTHTRHLLCCGSGELVMAPEEPGPPKSAGATPRPDPPDPLFLLPRGSFIESFFPCALFDFVRPHHMRLSSPLPFIGPLFPIIFLLQNPLFQGPFGHI